jgi:hypothetical protein
MGVGVEGMGWGDGLDVHIGDTRKPVNVPEHGASRSTNMRPFLHGKSVHCGVLIKGGLQSIQRCVIELMVSAMAAGRLCLNQIYITNQE